MHWHCIFTNSRQESKACNEIAKLGLETYCPVETRKRFKRGKKQIYSQPLFPRYSFVRFNVFEPAWTAINDIAEVVYILSDSLNRPQRLPDGLVETLISWQNMGLFDKSKAMCPFPIGSEVRLDEGSRFGGFIGKVLRARTNERVDILIKLLNREVTVWKVPVNRLSAA